MTLMSSLSAYAVNTSSILVCSQLQWNTKLRPTVSPHVEPGDYTGDLPVSKAFRWSFLPGIFKCTFYKKERRDFKARLFTRITEINQLIYRLFFSFHFIEYYFHPEFVVCFHFLVTDEIFEIIILLSCERKKTGRKKSRKREH